jgi:hypothetical protein
MFKVNEDKSIYITRGDIANIVVSATLKDGERFMFGAGDVVRFKVFGKKSCDRVYIQKDVEVEAETETVTISLTKEDTKIGDIIVKPFDYWYEVELNPDTEPQTIIGYDEDGEKVFRLYPEGSDTE